MTRNVTLRIDQDILKKCRYAAIEEDVSLSQWITLHISEIVKKQDSFNAAKARALRHLRQGYHLKGNAIKRDDLHER